MMPTVRANITTTFKVLNPHPPEIKEADREKKLVSRNDSSPEGEGVKFTRTERGTADAQSVRQAQMPRTDEARRLSGVEQLEYARSQEDAKREVRTQSRSEREEEKYLQEADEEVDLRSQQREDTLEATERSRERREQSVQDTSSESEFKPSPKRDFERTDVYRTVGEEVDKSRHGEGTRSTPSVDSEIGRNERSEEVKQARPDEGDSVVSSSPQIEDADSSRIGFELVELFSRSYPDEPKLTTRPVEAKSRASKDSDAADSNEAKPRNFDPTSTGVHRTIPEDSHETEITRQPAIHDLQREGVFGQTEDGRPRSATEFMRRKEFEYKFEEKPFTVDAFLRETERAIYDILKSPHIKTATRDLLEAAESVNAIRNHITATSDGDQQAEAPADTAKIRTGSVKAADTDS